MSFIRPLTPVMTFALVWLTTVYAEELASESKVSQPEIFLETAAYVGVAASPVSSALANHVDLPSGIGLVVDWIDPQSPALDKLQKYDILYQLNDQLLINPSQFAVLVRTYQPGDSVTLKVLRQGKPL